MKLYGKLDEEAITDISYNLKAFEEYDDVYYTTKEAVLIYDVYIPYEGEEPDDSVRGERTFEYKEGKLVKQGFKPY